MKDELTRLALQDHLFTRGMGGVLAEQKHPETFSRVLDVACGSGDWLIEVAHTYPMISQLIGVDLNYQCVEYARAQAREQHLDNRVEFQVMDALRMLEFPNKWFDLVNQRLGLSFLRKWDWGKLLQEYKRVCKPGGIVRITESDLTMGMVGPANRRFSELFLQTLTRAGHFFTAESNGVTKFLPALLEQHGFRDVQKQIYEIECRPGTPQGEYFLEDMRYLGRTLLPFFEKWSRVPDDYPQLCQQMLAELQQPDCNATWRLVTVWGTK
jgi:ubiquinone/menaquinone biosynthesis C-methylase UbiE